MFTDQNNAIINKSRMLTMRRMLLRQQELLLAEVEEVKKTKSLKNYVSREKWQSIKWFNFFFLSPGVNILRSAVIQPQCMK